MTYPNSKRHWFIDLVGALVCGFLIGAFQQRSADSGEFILGSFIRCVFLGMTSYSIVAVLLPAWRSRPFRILPNWLLIVVLGSGIFYFAIHLTDTLTYAVKFRYTQPELSLAQYVLSYFQQFIVGLLFVTVMDSILSLPIMGAIHYLGDKAFRPKNAG
jgi:hypothetical protein